MGQSLLSYRDPGFWTLAAKSTGVTFLHSRCYWLTFSRQSKPRGREPMQVNDQSLAPNLFSETRVAFNRTNPPRPFRPTIANRSSKDVSSDANQQSKPNSVPRTNFTNKPTGGDHQRLLDKTNPISTEIERHKQSHRSFMFAKGRFGSEQRTKICRTTSANFDPPVLRRTNPPTT